MADEFTKVNSPAEGEKPEGEIEADKSQEDEPAGGEGKGEPEGEGEDENLDPEKNEVPQRKSAATFIIDRQKQKIEKLRQQEKPEDDDLNLDEEELSPKGREALTREVERHVAPVLKAVKKQADDQEFSDHLEKNPSHKKYEPLARKYSEAKGWEAVPISFIFNSLASRDSEKIGAEKSRRADEEAKRGKLGASGAPRPSGSSEIPDVWSLSDAEFNKLVAQTKGIK